MNFFKMSHIPFVAFLILASVTIQPTNGTSPTLAPTSAPQPAYQPEASPSSYVPHATYPYAENYPDPGVGYPIYPGYNSIANGNPPSYHPPQGGFFSALVPSTQGVVHLALKLFAKIGLFLIGGVALLFVGGIFTTAVCSLTPICTISFPGLTGLDRDTMRSFMTPDKISAAAALVQDAIGKYQRLQRATGNK